MENYCAYILFSERLAKYYVGYTSDMEKRIQHHNSSQDRFSKKGVPWIIVLTVDCETKQAAQTLERKIKNMGAKRFLKNRDVVQSGRVS
jgi:putative endonuclease